VRTWGSIWGPGPGVRLGALKLLVYFSLAEDSLSARFSLMRSDEDLAEEAASAFEIAETYKSFLISGISGEYPK
jgi:hypothetical protein